MTWCKPAGMVYKNYSPLFENNNFCQPFLVDKAIVNHFWLTTAQSIKFD